MTDLATMAVVQSTPHPLVRLLVSFPIACFCTALITDIVYAATSNIMWADFSDWLLAIGMFMGVLAAIAGLVDLAANRRIRPRPSVALIVGSFLVLVAGFVDNLVHSRDAWTSVVPLGLGLSGVTVLLIIATLWLGGRTAARTAVVSTGYTGLRS